jgi:hypothetical protein
MRQNTEGAVGLRHSRTSGAVRLLAVLWWIGGTMGAHANAITDWDTKATAVASPAALGEREGAIVNIAMFDAVNSIERRYRPYLVQLAASEPISADAAAAAAAATALAALHPKRSDEFKSALADYLGKLAASPEAIAAGTQLGETVAAKVVAARANDGATATDTYRPKTRPGVYVPTATMVCSTWPTLRPFALASPSQFRPGPPAALTSKEWATDYNEIKEYGALESSHRTPEQTEAARFWLMTGPQAYHPIAREVVLASHLDLEDSARFMALFAAALTDAYIAVFDAKYHYEFWRPVTAIRNGETDGNAATQPDPTWQPLDSTPLHPEYPCAHCILSGTAATVIEALTGGQSLPELLLTSPTAPGVTHRWSNLDDFTAEVANARVWAGFHYRFSTRVGIAMGRQVGRYVTDHVLQPAQPGGH